MELTVDRVGAKSRVSSPVASLDRRRIVAVRAASPACEKPSWLVPRAVGSGFAGQANKVKDSQNQDRQARLDMKTNYSCIKKAAA